jgi:hypothetical protein
VSTDNSVFYGDIADLVVQLVGGDIDATEFQTSMAALLPDWDGTVEDAARRAMVAIQSLNAGLDAQFSRDQDISAWALGSATGGPASDGIFPIRVGTSTVNLPSPAKLTSMTLKGDPGTPSPQDVAIDVTGTFAASEYIAGFIVPENTTFIPGSSFAKSGTAPGAAYVIAIKKNGAAWGTITFAGGSTTGVTAIAAPTTVAGDLVQYFAPATFDGAFSHLTHSLKG